MANESASARLAPDLSNLRGLTYSIAYRMVGSVAEAEDIVQEAFLRFHRAQGEGVTVESPKAYLASITTRLSIDHMRSARARREVYVGEWLPEPFVDEREPPAAQNAEMEESLSMAFLLVLETLSPVERAVFLLREVFDYGYDEIAGIVEKSEENCRQVFARAKRHIENGKPRFEASREKRDALAREFFAACERGDLGELVRLLGADAVFHGDGGGKAAAVMHAVRGQDRVARLLHGIFTKGKAMGIRVRPAKVNGQPGALIFDSQDKLINVVALEIAGGAVRAVRSVINPDKLRHLGPVSELTRLPSRSGRASTSQE